MINLINGDCLTAMGVAAYEADRQFTGIELNDEYFKVATTRIDKIIENSVLKLVLNKKQCTIQTVIQKTLANN